LGQFVLPYVSPSPVANLSKNFESGLEPALCLNVPSFKLALLKTFHEVLNFVAGVVSSLGPMVQEILANFSSPANPLFKRLDEAYLQKIDF
jgi:hypothetical protein